jgi:hypothetical protein
MHNEYCLFASKEFSMLLQPEPSGIATSEVNAETTGGEKRTYSENVPVTSQNSNATQHVEEIAMKNRTV